MACSRALQLCECSTHEEVKEWAERDALRQAYVLELAREAAGEVQSTTTKKRRKPFSSTCTAKKYSLTQYVMQLVSKRNSISHLLENVSYDSAFKDFKSFIDFIQQHKEPDKSELSVLVYPIFVYFYILLLRSGPHGYYDARSFFKKNEYAFSGADSYADTLKTLYSFKNWGDVRKDEYYKNFLESKYIIGLSKKVLLSLRKFIECQAEKEGDLALLYVLSSHVYFQTVDEPDLSLNSTKDKISEPLPASTSSEVLPSRTTKRNENKAQKSGASKSAPNSSKFRAPQSSHKSSEMHTDSKRRCKNRDGANSISDLENLLCEMNINFPQISCVLTECNEAEICSVDFNSDETEIAYALKNNYVYIGILQKKREDITEENKTVKKRIDVEIKEIVLSRGRERKKLKYEKNLSGGREERGAVRSCEEDEKKVRGIKMPKGENVHLVKYLPGDPHLLLIAFEHTVKLFNTEKHIFLSEYFVSSFVMDIDVNSTSLYFATACMDGMSCLYSFKNPDRIHNFRILKDDRNHKGSVTAVRFHPNSIYIATGFDDGTIRIYNILSTMCIRRFSLGFSPIQSIAFSPDGKLLASGDYFGTVKTWNLADGAKVTEVRFSEVADNASRITGLCFHSNCSTLLACSYKGEIEIWNLKKHSQRITFLNIPMNVKFCNDGFWKIALKRRKDKNTNPE